MYSYKAGFAIFAVLFGLAANAHDAAAAECCVVGYQQCFSGNISEVSCPGGNLCGCQVSGTNCILTLDDDVDTSSANTCLTLGSGVTFDMNGNSINCTGSDCGKAVHNISSGGSSAKVVIKDGTITGCFDAALYFDASGGSNTNSSVADMTIDLGTGCDSTNGITYSNGDYFRIGIAHPQGPIARVDVKNAEIAVVAGADSAIEDSVLHDNVNGMIISNAAIDNVLFVNNSGAHLWDWKGAADPDISGSSFVGGACDCATTPSGASNAQTCQPAIGGYCGTYQAPPSHTCDGENCSIEQ